MRIIGRRNYVPKSLRLVSCLRLKRPAFALWFAYIISNPLYQVHMDKETEAQTPPTGGVQPPESSPLQGAPPSEPPSIIKATPPVDARVPVHRIAAAGGGVKTTGLYAGGRQFASVYSQSVTDQSRPSQISASSNRYAVLFDDICPSVPLAKTRDRPTDHMSDIDRALAASENIVRISPLGASPAPSRSTSVSSQASRRPGTDRRERNPNYQRTPAERIQVVDAIEREAKLKLDDDKREAAVIRTAENNVKKEELKRLMSLKPSFEVRQLYTKLDVEVTILAKIVYALLNFLKAALPYLTRLVQFLRFGTVHENTVIATHDGDVYDHTPRELSVYHYRPLHSSVLRDHHDAATRLGYRSYHDVVVYDPVVRSLMSRLAKPQAHTLLSFRHYAITAFKDDVEILARPDGMQVLVHSADYAVQQIELSAETASLYSSMIPIVNTHQTAFGDALNELGVILALLLVSLFFLFAFMTVSVRFLSLSSTTVYGLIAKIQTISVDCQPVLRLRGSVRPESIPVMCAVSGAMQSIAVMLWNVVSCLSPVAELSVTLLSSAVDYMMRIVESTSQHLLIIAVLLIVAILGRVFFTLELLMVSPRTIFLRLLPVFCVSVFLINLVCMHNYIGTSTHALRGSISATTGVAGVSA